MQQKRFIEKDIKIRVSEELHARLKRISEKNSQPMASQIRVYITDGLKRDESIMEGGLEIVSEEQISSQRSSEKDNRL